MKHISNLSDHSSQEAITVEVACLPFAAQLADQFGLPRVQDLARDELVGPYGLFSVGGGFLKYTASRHTWSKVEEATQESAMLLPIEGLSEEEHVSLWEDMKLAGLGAPDRFPADTTRLTSEEPFIYQRWVLQWVFIPQLRRWELAPLGRA